ncbi:MAG: ribonuclease H [Microbacterium sp.]
MTITAAADGSALGNPGPNGWAWYIDDDNWAAGGSPHGTNNQGELRAVLELLQATAGADEDLLILCDSKYVIDSITKWMPGWKRRGWRKSDGGAVLNRDLMEALDGAMSGRDVRFEWVKGHAGHPLNEAADERANAAAKAYQQKQEPRRGPGFVRSLDTEGVARAATAVQDAAEAGAAPATRAPATAAPAPAHQAPATAAPATAPRAPANSASTTPVSATPTPAPRASTPPASTRQVPATPASAGPTPLLWAEASDLLDGLDDAPAASPIELRVALTADEHARLRDRADAQGLSLVEALRRLI